MLRYKRWTFEAWYQSECTNIPSLAPWLAQYHLETILGNESYLVISFHYSILQLTFITQAWMCKFNTCAMQASIWNAHSNAPYKFLSLLPLLVWSKFKLIPFLCHISPPMSNSPCTSTFVISPPITYIFVSFPPLLSFHYLCTLSLPLCHQWPQRFKM